MEKATRNQFQTYPEYNLSTQLLKHQHEMLRFLFYTSYDIIYETFQLKHAAYLTKKRGYPVQNFKTQQIARHYQIMSDKLHIRIMRDDIQLDKKLGKLQILWHTRNIPYFHRYYVQKYLGTTFIKNIESLLQNEMKLVSQQKHLYYTIFKTINARQACLRQLKKHLAQLNQQDVHQYLHVARQRLFNQRKKNQQQKYKKKGYKLRTVEQIQQTKHSKTKFQFFSDNFNHLTKLTLYVMDLIAKWKQYIRSLTHDVKKQRERIQYYFYDDNYYLKILSDANFIKVSFLSQFYNFPPKNDPFLFGTILAFEKLQQKTVQHELLKMIFMPQPEQLSEILLKLEELAEQYKSNIRSRKSYDINVLKNNEQIANQKMRINNQKRLEPISNLVLKKINDSPPRRTKSFQNFRIKQQQPLSTNRNQLNKSKSTQKDKILIEFKTNTKRKNMWLPGAIPKIFKQTQDSPLKNSIILERNPVNNGESLVDQQLLKMLKKQVVRKIKQDFQLNISQQKDKDKALQMYIDNKVKEAMKGIFPYLPQKQLKLPIELSIYRVKQEDVAGQISKIFKLSIAEYTQMQVTSIDLLKKIEIADFVYFIKAVIGQEEISKMMFTLDKQTQEYKVIKLLYMGINDISLLPTLMKQSKKLLENNQNAYQIHFPFLQPVNNQTVKQCLLNLQKNLKGQATVVSKQVYSNVAQIRYIFKKNGKNVNYIPNTNPNALHFKLSLVFSQKKIFLQTGHIEKKYSSYVDYDYILSEIIRKLIDSSDINILKQKKFSPQRFKEILQNIVQLEKGQQNKICTIIKLLQADNISDLNKQLVKNNQKSAFLQISDTIKKNKVHMFTIQQSVQLPYFSKCIIQKNGLMYYRYSVKQAINYHRHEGTTFYKFNLQTTPAIQQNAQLKEKHNRRRMIIFAANEFVNEGHTDLSTYLLKSFYGDMSFQNEQKLLINNFWLQMIRYPEKWTQRQDSYMKTHKLQDLTLLKKQLYIGQFLQWFCDAQMQNGIIYSQPQMGKSDIMIQKPFGVVLTEGQRNTIIYARVFN